MKKLKLTITGLILTLFVGGLVWNSSFPLQDGYRLQGGLFSNGCLYRGWFFKVISEEVMGLQGSKKGFIYGWVKGGNRYFIVNTKTSEVEWHDAGSFGFALVKYGCPSSDMNREVNLTSLRDGLRRFSSE